MKQMLWFLTAIVLFSIPFAAEAQFPKPRPAAAPQATAQAAPAPAVATAPVAAPAPVVNVSPQLVAPVPNAMDEIKSWLNTALAGLIAFFLGKIGFKPAPTQVVPVGAAAEPTTASGLLKTIADPGLRAQADQAILTVIRSGIPGMGVQAGLGMIPGVGALAAQGEPLLRSMIDRIVSDRLAQNKAASTP